MKIVAKKTKTRKIKKRIWNKKVGILSYAMAMVAIVALAAYMRILQPQQLPPPKASAEDYFSFSGVFALADPVYPPSNTTLQIKQLGFNITAIMGNATDLEVVPYTGMVKQNDAWVSSDKLIHQNETVEVAPIMYPTPYPEATKEGDEGWGPMEFVISCKEAYGAVYLYVTGFVPSSR